MKERLREVRKSLNMSMEEFGGRLGVTRSAISRLEAGRSNLTEQMIKSICREFNVSYIWLKDGVGEGPFESCEQEVTATFDRIMASENETAKAVFKSFAKLGDQEWLMLQNLIEDIAKNIKK